MVVGYHNIFPLDKAEEYRCDIDHYTTSHKELRVAVSHESVSPFYLLFTDVKYFSGPTEWQGANFRLIENSDEHLRILKSLKRFDKWSQDNLLKRVQVYLVGAPANVEIMIVAADVGRIELNSK
jgi:hypothetical protein